MTRDEGKAARVVVLELERDDYVDVYVRIHVEGRVVEVFTVTDDDGPGDLVATAPLGHTLIEWKDDARARYPASD